MYSKFKKYLVNFLSKFLVILFWGMCIVIFIGVIFRMIERPLVWAEEYALISMVWLTFIGAAIGYDANSHLAVDFLMQILPLKGSKFVEIIIEFLMLPLFIVLVIGGIEMVETTRASITPALNISVAFQYMPALIGGILLVIFNIEKIISKIRNYNNIEKVERGIN